MTRDEHIKIEMDRLMAGPALCGQHPGIVREVAETNVNCFVRHGILKLDEPLSIEERLNQASKQVAISSPIGGWGYVPPGVILQIAAEAGLRIVEK